MSNGSEPWRVFEHPIYIEARANRIANLFAHFDPTRFRGKRILEAGCGTGELGESFEEYGCAVVSVDARQEFLERLREKYPHRETHRVDLEHWDPRALGRFDAVLAFGILYVLAEPESFLEKCTSITDTIFLESIVIDSPWADYLRIPDYQSDGAWSGVASRPSSAWITSTLERYGFTTQDISSASANWFGSYPSIFDWEPRNEGGWVRDSATLRRMMICSRSSTHVRKTAASPIPFSATLSELTLDLMPGDPQSARTLRTLRRAGYGVVREMHAGQNSRVEFRRLADNDVELRPLLVHVHMPKCAGTSFLEVLRSSFGAQHLDYYPEDTSHLLTREEWLRLIVGNPGITSFSSHSLRVYPPIVADRRALYVCFLRDPVRRYVSHLTYYKKHFSTFPETLRQQLPPNCPELPLREVARWLQDNQPDSFHRNLLATNFIGEQTWVDQLAEMMGLSARWLDEGWILGAGFNVAKLQLATSLLENFLFVGIVEEMDASLQALKRELQPYGLTLTADRAPIENASREVADDLTWLTRSDPVGCRVLDELKTDIRLYQRFEWRFRTSLRTQAVHPNDTQNEPK